MATYTEITEEIQRLKAEKNAVILAHNYQIPEVQDLADYVGDSLGLSQIAGRTEAEMIVFCGVHFMAETAAIISPDKKVLIPDPEAGCSLADSITVEQLREWKRQHPDAVVVSYVNTTAAIKAESDYCCTSTNAVKVVQAIPEDREILFLPDMFLGAYISEVTGRKLYIWPGECHVHAAIRPEEIVEMRRAHPTADMLIHPECGCVTSCMYLTTDDSVGLGETYIYSTEGMIKHVNRSPRDEFLIATEVGILHRMQKEAPGKTFYPINREAICQYMKMITPEKVLRSLREEVFEVRVDEAIASKARRAIDRMLAIV
ncbi:MAG: quinolinate synthase NadA [candidate division KSB1 bacterium]|nr:quinolinate synthase NadA [candidate division KSB1 bacterium]MDQ7064740.1 quinolinate synthase NadA [candidate division KSB1 bacterium]